MRSQDGFTLLELMVAMAIFAMLAVAGWQVFDSVNRARERAQFHADNVAALQYAYLQLQQDMGQIIPYRALSTQNSTNDTNPNSQENLPAPEPFLQLDSERLSFVRFADPDPRYQSSPSVQHIEYIFADERLIRRQYTSIGGGSDSISLDSVLLEGVSAGRWQAYLPEPSKEFPSNDSNSTNASRSLGQGVDSATAQTDIVLLPKGIVVNFTYQDMPITWQWALALQPLPNTSHNKGSKAANNPNDNNSGNSNSNSNSNSNNGTSNDSADNSNIENNNLGNPNGDVPFGQ